MSLDDHLAAWAASVRLTDADAEAIYQRIIFQSAVVEDAGAASRAGRQARRPRVVTAFPAAAASAAALCAPALCAPAGLAPSWWRDYTKGFAARMVAATRPVPAAA